MAQEYYLVIHNTIFYEDVNNVIEENKYKFSNLGVQLGDLGYHSYWKGYWIMVTSGCIFLLHIGNHFTKVDPVKDRYIIYDKAEDNYVGKEITEVLLLKTGFVVSL